MPEQQSIEIVPKSSQEVNATQAARRLRVSVPTLRKLPIPYRQLVKGGTVYYLVSDLKAFVESRSFNHST